MTLHFDKVTRSTPGSRRNVITTLPLPVRMFINGPYLMTSYRWKTKLYMECIFYCFYITNKVKEEVFYFLFLSINL